jgi:hypothetical protein
MATQQQIAANRINARKSTGPKTPQGRAAVRLNGLKHGLTSSALVLRGESQSDFEDLLDSFAAEHHPATPTEEALVRQMAMAQWRLRRLYHMEAGFFAVGLIRLEDDIERFHDLDPGDEQSIVARNDSFNGNTLANFSRYEARLERSFYKALQELRNLRASRPSTLKKQTQFAPPNEIIAIGAPPPAPDPLIRPPVQTPTPDPA